MVRKNITVVLLYLTEVIIAVSAITMITLKVWPLPDGTSVFDRAVNSYVIYQIVIYAVLKLRADAIYDMYSAFKYACSIGKVSLLTNDKTSEENLFKTIEKQRDNSIMNNKKVIEKYYALEKCMIDKNVDAIDFLIADAEHNMELAQFEWNFSLLVRIFK